MTIIAIPNASHDRYFWIWQKSEKYKKINGIFGIDPSQLTIITPLCAFFGRKIVNNHQKKANRKILGFGNFVNLDSRLRNTQVSKNIIIITSTHAEGMFTVLSMHILGYGSQYMVVLWRGEGERWGRSKLTKQKKINTKFWFSTPLQPCPCSF